MAFLHQTLISLQRTLLLACAGMLLASFWMGCGSRTPSVSDPSIFGGQPVPSGAWPEVLAVVSRKNPQSAWHLECTGTLIAPQAVLTAGHCLEGFEDSQLADTDSHQVISAPEPQEKPRLGISRGTGVEGGVFTEVVPVTRAILYPYFREHPLGTADIGLLFLAAPIPDLAPAKIPVTLAESRAVALTGKALLVGYGLREDAGVGVKYQVETGLMSRSPLEAVAGGAGKDACDGDSGGPAYGQLADGSWRQAGVVARGINFECGAGGYLTITSQVACWVRNTVASAFGDEAFPYAVDGCGMASAPHDAPVVASEADFVDFCAGKTGTASQQTNARNIHLMIAGSDCRASFERLESQNDVVLDGGMLDDISSLMGKKSLVHLSLVGNFLTDLSPLLTMPRLRTIHIEGNDARDPHVLSVLKERGVQVFGKRRQLGNFAQTVFLKTCLSPETPPEARRTVQVIMWKTLAEDCLTANHRILAVKKLSLKDRGLTDISPLAGLEHLESLDLSQNPISDVSSLAEFESLKVLNISGTKVVNLDPLKDLVAAGLRVKKD
jgi:hypothetical protein